MKKHRVLPFLFFAALAAASVFSGCQKDLPPIEIKIEATPIGGSAPLDVTAKCVVLSGKITEFSWDFGDGGSAYGSEDAFHRYTKAGTYTMTVTVTGYEGSEDNPEPVTKTAYLTISVFQPNVPPVAGFQFSPINDIVADKTSVSFSNTTSGMATSWQWDFGTNESGSTTQSPSRAFDYAGTKTVRLTASGPLGTSTTTKTVTVHAMPPTCHNYTGGSTQSASAIQTIRNNGQLKNGQVVFNNNYSNVTAKVEFFTADNWLNGKYNPLPYYWEIGPGKTYSLVNGSSNMVIGSDWGIRITFSSGGVTCVRTVNDIASFGSGKFTLTSQKVNEGQ
ncbi:MAG: PKD domain-containing protein [Saprospiraceae bacterium]